MRTMPKLHYTQTATDAQTLHRVEMLDFHRNLYRVPDYSLYVLKFSI